MFCHPADEARPSPPKHRTIPGYPEPGPTLHPVSHSLWASQVEEAREDKRWGGANLEEAQGLGYFPYDSPYSKKQFASSCHQSSGAPPTLTAPEVRDPHFEPGFHSAHSMACHSLLDCWPLDKNGPGLPSVFSPCLLKWYLPSQQLGGDSFSPHLSSPHNYLSWSEIYFFSPPHLLLPPSILPFSGSL